jgi:uncharacterized protein YjbI with pentapeptide repeats
MKIQMMVKQVSLYLISGLAATGFLWSNTALAQTPVKTPVSTSMHLSGSCAKCDLSRRVMPGMSLRGANFTGSDFSHSNLAGANFTQANLDDTSFYKAYLMRVKGVRVNLNKSILRGTTLSDVSLVSSNFTSADLHKADLTNGDFTGSNFSKARLKSADAMGAIFVRANFTNAKLDHGDFEGADFSGAQFLFTNFGDAVVENADFSGANFSGAEMVDIIGLSQSQLDVACGSQKTQLPEGYSMRVCPKKVEILVDKAETIPAPSPSIVGIGSTPKPPRLMKATRIPRRGQMLSIRSAELDEIMRGIDGMLGDFPMDSPSRAKLEKVRGQLEVVQAQIGEQRK